MGLLDKLKGQPKIGGIIGSRGLTDWWLSAFTEEERRHILARYGAEAIPLTSGTLSSLEDQFHWGEKHSTTDVLMRLSGWSNNAEDRAIAKRFLAKAEELSANAPILDRHFLYMTMIKTHYSDRERVPAALPTAIAACQQQIALAPQAATTFRHEYRNSELPSHPGYTQLCIIYEKQKDYEAAIELAKQAQAQGWHGDWDKRIARCQKRLAKHQANAVD